MGTDEGSLQGTGAAEMNAIVRPKRQRELTGTAVLICFVGFFAIVATVNAIMVHAAITTFAGTQTASAYKAGLAYKGEEAAALAQDALNWQVSGNLERTTSGEAQLTIDIRDARRSPVYGIAIDARLAHPLNARLDRSVTLARVSDTTFRGMIDLPAGQWTLTLDVMREGNRIYRNVSRLVLK